VGVDSHGDVYVAEVAPDLRGEPQQCPRGLPYLPGVL